ncbi:MAG: cyclodeaminase/cyclohydrolase family protein [Lachnospiraceae bacterium]|nr:cyclodeaminase/cyclohydrolase family protein [Lachnospiraceae bacterium]
MYKQKQVSIEDYLRMLNSKAPVPGGGGASALCGALCAGLAAMVCSLTIGKEKYAAVESNMIHSMSNIVNIQDDLCDCMDADAQAFEPLAKAYKLPKDTPEQAAYKSKVLEEKLHDAAEPPLRICELIMNLYNDIAFVAKNGSRLAVSDAGCAAAMAAAAYRAAALNVYVNTKLMKDREYAEDIERRVKSMSFVVAGYEEIYNNVAKELGA